MEIFCRIWLGSKDFHHKGFSSKPFRSRNQWINIMSIFRYSLSRHWKSIFCSEWSGEIENELQLHDSKSLFYQELFGSLRSSTYIWKAKTIIFCTLWEYFKIVHVRLDLSERSAWFSVAHRTRNNLLMMSINYVRYLLFCISTQFMTAHSVQSCQIIWSV